MTIALISVATRYNDHNGGSEQAARSHHTGSSPAPSAGGTSGPATSSPSTQPTQSGGSPAGTASGGRRHGGTGSSGTGSSGTGSSGTGQNGGVATLPNTGNSTQTIELAALAALFIAAGSFSVRISRTKPRG